eukprot:3838684-Alexandrium_andersonii.AAC.1
MRAAPKAAGPSWVGAAVVRSAWAAASPRTSEGEELASEELPLLPGFGARRLSRAADARAVACWTPSAEPCGETA